MKRSNSHSLNDMKASIARIETYIKDMDYEDFLEDDRTKDAVIRNLEIIGEAARNLDDEVRKENQSVPWRKIIGLRNIISHAYFGIDWENIWKIIKEDIPGFRAEVGIIEVD